MKFNCEQTPWPRFAAVILRRSLKGDTFKRDKQHHQPRSKRTKTIRIDFRLTICLEAAKTASFQKLFENFFAGRLGKCLPSKQTLAGSLRSSGCVNQSDLKREQKSNLFMSMRSDPPLWDSQFVVVDNSVNCWPQTMQLISLNFFKFNNF